MIKCNLNYTEVEKYFNIKQNKGFPRNLESITNFLWDCCIIQALAICCFLNAQMGKVYILYTHSFSLCCFLLQGIGNNSTLKSPDTENVKGKLADLSIQLLGGTIKIWEKSNARTKIRKISLPVRWMFKIRKCSFHLVFALGFFGGWVGFEFSWLILVESRIKAKA